MMGNRFFQAALGSVTVIFSGFLIWAMVSLILMPEKEEIFESALSEEMLYSIHLSLSTSLLSVALVMLLAVSIGYLLARFTFPGHHLLRTIVDLPMAFPELVLGLCLLLLFRPRSLCGLAEKRGGKRGVQQVGHCGSPGLYRRSLRHPGGIRHLPGNQSPVRNGGPKPGIQPVQRLSPGFGSHGSGGLFAAAVIAFARCMGCFGTVLILAGGTRMYTETLPITLYLNISYGNLAMAMTSGIILIAISLGAIIVFEILNREVVL